MHFGPLVALDQSFSSLEVVCISLIMHLFPLHCSCFVLALYWIALGARCTQYFHQGSVKRCAGGLVISAQVALRPPTTSAFISELLRNWNCNWTLLPVEVNFEQKNQICWAFVNYEYYIQSHSGWWYIATSPNFLSFLVEHSWRQNIIPSHPASSDRTSHHPI